MCVLDPMLCPRQPSGALFINMKWLKSKRRSRYLFYWMWYMCTMNFILPSLWNKWNRKQSDVWLYVHILIRWACFHMRDAVGRVRMHTLPGGWLYVINATHPSLTDFLQPPWNIFLSFITAHSACRSSGTAKLSSKTFDAFLEIFSWLFPVIVEQFLPPCLYFPFRYLWDTHVRISENMCV